MPLLLHRREFGHDQFSVYDAERYIGRLYKTTRGDWFWGLDPFAAGSTEGYMASPAQAMAMLTAAWESCSKRPAPSAFTS